MSSCHPIWFPCSICNFCMIFYQKLFFMLKELVHILKQTTFLYIIRKIQIPSNHNLKSWLSVNKRRKDSQEEQVTATTLNHKPTTIDPVHCTLIRKVIHKFFMQINNDNMLTCSVPPLIFSQVFYFIKPFLQISINNITKYHEKFQSVETWWFLHKP